MGVDPEGRLLDPVLEIEFPHEAVEWLAPDREQAGPAIVAVGVDRPDLAGIGKQAARLVLRVGDLRSKKWWRQIVVEVDGDSSDGGKGAATVSKSNRMRAAGLER
jgi:hypothetical protein